MQVCNKKKFICFLLVAGMLLSAMCFEKVQADFIFVDETLTKMPDITVMGNQLFGTENILHNTSRSERNPSRMKIPEGNIFSPEVRTEEIVQRSVASSTKTTGKIRQKTGGLLHDSQNLKENAQILFWNSPPERDSQTHSNRVIIQYIHQKDGKKASIHRIG